MNCEMRGEGENSKWKMGRKAENGITRKNRQEVRNVQ